MLNKLRKLDLRGEIGSIKGTKLMKGVLLRVGLRFKPVLGTTRGFLTKFLPFFQRPTRIGFITSSPKSLEVEVHQVINPPFSSVARNSGVNVK